MEKQPRIDQELVEEQRSLHGAALQIADTAAKAGTATLAGLAAKDA
jgi:hypothetical protein